MSYAAQADLDFERNFAGAYSATLGFTFKSERLYRLGQIDCLV